MLIELTDEYLIGNADIDEQHLKLCKIINSLHEDIERSASIDVLMGTLQFLTDYTSQHFEFEEKLMLECEYPGLEEHAKQHRELVDELSKYNEKFFHHVNVNREAKFAKEFLEFLKYWLLEHIMKSDFKIKPYL
ncbi:MAG: hemerythrin family protein [Kordiimonadaceae bacterium]|jgi:hemerythrin-like metal-binding protein|nr:hemerythrin family protein [Kordiimonadaceae bacterium]